VPSERCSIEEQSLKYCVDGCVVSSDMVCGDLRSPCTMSLDTTRQFTIFCLTAPQSSISQKALGMLLEDGNVMPKCVGATMHN
jgi:hypothetical protein